MDELMSLIDLQCASLLMDDGVDKNRSLKPLQIQDQRLDVSPSELLIKHEPEYPQNFFESVEQRPPRVARENTDTTRSFEFFPNVVRGADDDRTQHKEWERAYGRHSTVVSANSTFINALEKLILEHSSVMRSIRERIASAVSIDESFLFTPWGRRKVLKHNLLRERALQQPWQCFMIIRDIDVDYGQLLQTLFPNHINPVFLAKHMIRLDNSTVTEQAIANLQKDITQHDMKLYAKDGALNSRKFFFAHEGSDSRDPAQSFHIDFVVKSGADSWVPEDMTDQQAGDLPRGDVFQQALSGSWRKVSTRLSCCELENQLYLILIDRELDIMPSPNPSPLAPIDSPFQTLLCVRIGISQPLPLRIPLHVALERYQNPSEWMGSILERLLAQHTVQSLFGSRMSGTSRLPLNVQKWSHRHTFVSLFALSNWQAAVADLEVRSKQSQRKATRLAGDEAFQSLISLRREVSNAYELIADATQNLTRATEEISRQVGIYSADDEFWTVGKPKQSSTLVFPRQRQVTDMLDSMGKLESQVSAMLRTINEEIQVAIGTVQVEDAKTVMRQTQVMQHQTDVVKRQTEVAVVLAALAAIYLPLTLVTGIFGMNITEINTDATRPDKWSVVKTWGVVFGATLGIIVFYVAVRWLVMHLRYKREALRKKYPQATITWKRVLDTEAESLMTCTIGAGVRVSGWLLSRRARSRTQALPTLD